MTTFSHWTPDATNQLQLDAWDDLDLETEFLDEDAFKEASGCLCMPVLAIAS